MLHTRANVQGLTGEPMGPMGPRRRMADAMGEVCEPRSGVERAALSTLPVACLIHAGSISAQVYQDEKPTEGKKSEFKND